MSKQVILTGLRTNGEIHLGNYLGAVLPMVEMTKKHAAEYQINMFIPDLHSFTTEIDHKNFYKQTMSNLKLFIASGIPLDEITVDIYRQSRISAHSELTVIMNNFAPFGELSRMTEFKDKESRMENVTAGLFDYPVLMASDILLYSAAYVPVGEDQRQHLEFTRNLAERFNNKFGEIFVVPKTIAEQQVFVGRESAPRIRSLRNPEKKMSKSISDPSGTILLSDKPDEARKKIMKAETDNIGMVNFDFENQPGVSNLLQILALLRKEPQAVINSEFVGSGRYGDLKNAVADQVASTLDMIQENLSKVDDSKLEAKILQSENKMQQIANSKLAEVQRAVGLR